jgi:hypothetical protein
VSVTDKRSAGVPPSEKEIYERTVCRGNRTSPVSRASDHVLRLTPYVALVTVCSMALEKRDGNLYYYRHVRDGLRVRKVYVGSGELALLAHEDDLIRRAAEKHKRKEEREEREKLEALASSVDELSDVAEILARASLVAGGYRRYQGHWRLKRSE